MPAIRAAILTVSDSASRDSSLDKSGPTAVELLRQRGLSVSELKIVPDDEQQIRQAVCAWGFSNTVDLVLTLGGTGFGTRDRTPEAISGVLERHASGLVHLMLSTSLQHTPLAALGRPVAGTIGNTLVVTLPGSVKAVKENIEALLSGGVLDHAIELNRGGSGQHVHAELAADGHGPSHDLLQAQRESAPSHEHHHHHHHHHHDERTALSHDPSLPPSTRNRKSPYPLISLDEALETIRQKVKPLSTDMLQVGPELKGHVLAEDIFAPQDVPSSPTTSVDGYALRSSDPPGVYKVVTSRNHGLSTPLPDGFIYRINTGAPLPAGADTVIMVEDTHVVSTYDDGEEKEVKTMLQVPPQQDVRTPGSDVQKGDLVLRRGELISARGGEIGLLAFVGRKEVEVYRKPIVAILSTGNEITDIQSSNEGVGEDGWGGIWDTNRPSLQAALEGMGYQVLDLGIVPDSVHAHESALRRGLIEANVIVTTGGTSMGPSDLLKPVIERNLGGSIHFGRVTVKPGKPTTFATIPREHGRTPLFALPGNPASALVTFYVFVVPALRQMGGWAPERCHLPRVKVELQDPMKIDPRTEFHRVISL